MDKNTCFEKVKAIIAETIDCDENSIKLESSFVNDLKADSMDVLGLVSGFEEEFGISIPDEKGRDFEKVEDAVNYICENI